jgi:hypothetical protein
LFSCTAVTSVILPFAIVTFTSVVPNRVVTALPVTAALIGEPVLEPVDADGLGVAEPADAPDGEVLVDELPPAAEFGTLAAGTGL